MNSMALSAELLSIPVYVQIISVNPNYRSGSYRQRQKEGRQAPTQSLGSWVYSVLHSIASSERHAVAILSGETRCLQQNCSTTSTDSDPRNY